MLVEGLLESYAHKVKLHEVYWQGWALWMDLVSFAALVLMYSLVLVVLFGFVGSVPEAALADRPITRP